jgi:hypothetical protein
LLDRGKRKEGFGSQLHSTYRTTLPSLKTNKKGVSISFKHTSKEKDRKGRRPEEALLFANNL